MFDFLFVPFCYPYFPTTSLQTPHHTTSKTISFQVNKKKCRQESNLLKTEKNKLKLRAEVSVLPVKADSSTQPDCRRLEDKLPLRATQRGAGNAVQPPLSLNSTREIHYDCAVISLQCRHSTKGPNRKNSPELRKTKEHEDSRRLNLVRPFNRGLNSGREVRRSGCWYRTAALSSLTQGVVWEDKYGFDKQKKNSNAYTTSFLEAHWCSSTTTDCGGQRWA